MGSGLKGSCRKTTDRQRLSEIFNLLYKFYGPRRWWPADTPFEVIVGAILTQNTSWNNVEKAMASLKKEGLLTPKHLYDLDQKKLASLIKPCGYYNIKAKRIKSLLDYIFKQYNGSLKRFFKNSTKKLRKELLSINGVGPETADSIILYAAGRPIFVVDAYTNRILQRHNLIDKGSGYDDIQSFFHNNLPKRRALFNEFHALIVEHAKSVCKTKPNCQACILHAIKS